MLLLALKAVFIRAFSGVCGCVGYVPEHSPVSPLLPSNVEKG